MVDEIMRNKINIIIIRKGMYREREERGEGEILRFFTIDVM